MRAKLWDRSSQAICLVPRPHHSTEGRDPFRGSATGGIKEVVVDGETGYLVPFEQDPVTSFPVDPEKFARDLAAGINRLLEDPDKCRLFGNAGRRRVEEIFNWSAIAQQTLRLYEKLIQRWSTGVQT